METNNRNPKESIIIMVAILILVFLLKGHVIVLWAALIISFLSLLSTGFATLTHSLFTKITYAIGLVIQKVILIIIFFIVLTPLAFLSRIFGKKDVMMLKRNNKSTFSDRVEKIDKSYFEKLW